MEPPEYADARPATVTDSPLEPLEPLGVV
jgi:hypothetical protein